MAVRDIHRVADRWFAQLNATVNNSTTSWVLKSSGSDGLPALPCIVHCGTEKVEITAVAVDTPSAGLDTLTVVRGYGGSSAASHDADAYVALYLYEDVFNDVFERLQRLERWAAARCGDDNGVIQVDSPSTALEVTAQGTPDMTVNVAAGSAIVAGHPTSLLAAYTTSTFTAPSGNPRIDVLQIDQSGNIEIKAGSENASPSAPSVDADALKLAEIYHRVGETSIKDTDDASNGYITDARVHV